MRERKGDGFVEEGRPSEGCLREGRVVVGVDLHSGRIRVRSVFGRIGERKERKGGRSREEMERPDSLTGKPSLRCSSRSLTLPKTTTPFTPLPFAPKVINPPQEELFAP